ncbi:MAG TPA: DsbA family protein [Candidatus Thermoplasmatota archaeon]|nr:DsbA family protein [Candidatus Thermoplasmatota archaeon]
MVTTVPVIFDFACPWTYSARNREKQLAKELGVSFEHLPWELNPTAPAEGMPNPYAVPGDALLAFARSTGTPLRGRPVTHNTRKALRGLFFARTHGKYDEYVDAGLQAYWQEQANLADDAVLRRIAERAGLDADAFLRFVNDDAMDGYLSAVDAWAEKLGVATTVTYLLPTKEGGPSLYQGLGTHEEVRAALKAALA